MWIVTTRGFVSAVEEKSGPHKGELKVRARDRKHAELVAALVEGRTPKVEITPAGDYRYRFHVSHAEFEQVVVALAREVTYGNFKDEVLRKQGHSRYEAALHSVWTVLSKLQPGGPYGCGGYGYPTIPKGEPKRKPWKPAPAPTRKGDVACVYCGFASERKFFMRTAKGSGDWMCRSSAACVERMASPAAV